jgi:hypothetical protein
MTGRREAILKSLKSRWTVLLTECSEDYEVSLPAAAQQFS